MSTKELPEGHPEVKPSLTERLHQHHTEHLERLQRVSDPYELLLLIERHQREACCTRAAAIQYAMRHYGRFVAMTSEQLRADQDALVHAAKRIFRVNVPTLRADIRSATLPRMSAA